jgi:hypothetical protein
MRVLAESGHLQHVAIATANDVELTASRLVDEEPEPAEAAAFQALVVPTIR